VFVRKVWVDGTGDLIGVWNPGPALSANLAALLPAAAPELGHRRYGACERGGGPLQYVVARNDHVPQEGLINEKDDEEIELGNPPIEEIAYKRRSGGDDDRSARGRGLRRPDLTHRVLTPAAPIGRIDRFIGPVFSHSQPGVNGAFFELQPESLEGFAGPGRIPAALVEGRRIFTRVVRAPLAARFANAPDVAGISEVGESLEKFRIRALE
jgi:hypothetical protein